MVFQLHFPLLGQRSQLLIGSFLRITPGFGHSCSSGSLTENEEARDLFLGLPRLETHFSLAGGVT